MQSYDFMKKCRHIALAAPLLFSLFTASAHADPLCDAMTHPIYHVINPAIPAGLLTPWKNEAEKAIAQFGFTEDQGVAFHASLTPVKGLVNAVRMYHPKNHDFFWTVNPAEQDKAEQQYGYIKQNDNSGFYVSSLPLPCAQPVYRYQKGGYHRHTTRPAEQQALEADGWTLENARFFAVLKQPDTAPVFSIAIMPDTQEEVQAIWNGVRALNDKRFIERSQWLAENKADLNLQFVLHSGDVVNWGEHDPHQYDIASKGMIPLEDAGIPYVLSAGNHDTRAVCAGGSACDNKSYISVRETPLFNQYFKGRFGNLAGQYQDNDLTNVYSLFEAGNRQWMVLSLELWPRTQVIEWAKDVVQRHPKHNVIVVTHAYLDWAGNISNSSGGYGANSPRYLFDQLISQYPNIRFVLSGHTGEAAARIDTGRYGNKIASFLQTFHDGTGNPVRILEIDTEEDSATTYIYVPKTGQYKNTYTWETTDMKYVH